MIVDETEYFFINKITKVNRKTPIYYVISRDMTPIGEIKWFSHWRKFCFFAYDNSIWDNKCLQEIINLMEKYNNDWKNLV